MPHQCPPTPQTSPRVPSLPLSTAPTCFLSPWSVCEHKCLRIQLYVFIYPYFTETFEPPVESVHLLHKHSVHRLIVHHRVLLSHFLQVERRWQLIGYIIIVYI